MSMFGPKMGTWWVQCKSDPRWDKEGRGLGLVTNRGPEEMKNWIRGCKAKYGEYPDDLTWKFMKD